MKKYQNERKIRLIYRAVGRRRTYVQRIVYDESCIQIGNETKNHRTDGLKNILQNEWLSKSFLDRSRITRRTRIVTRIRRSRLFYRIINPGRFYLESRKRIKYRFGTNRCGRRRLFNWYVTDRELSGTDRRRSRRTTSRILWGVRFNQNREIRIRLRWIRRIYLIRIEKKRIDRENIRSRCVFIAGYRRCSERRRRRIYRRKGRK